MGSFVHGSRRTVPVDKYFRGVWVLGIGSLGEDKRSSHVTLTDIMSVRILPNLM